MKQKPPNVIAVGFDNKDGHKRVTTGEGFALLSGSKETHAIMVEKAVKINEKLKKRGKDMSTATADEFGDAAHSVGLVRSDEIVRRQESN